MLRPAPRYCSSPLTCVPCVLGSGLMCVTGCQWALKKASISVGSNSTSAQVCVYIVFSWCFSWSVHSSAAYFVICLPKYLFTYLFMVYLFPPLHIFIYLIADQRFWGMFPASPFCSSLYEIFWLFKRHARDLSHSQPHITGSCTESYLPVISSLHLESFCQDSVNHEKSAALKCSFMASQ